MKIYLFESEVGNHKNLTPFIENHAIFELKYGCLSILDRIRRFYPNAEIILIVPKEIKEHISAKYPHYTVNPKIIDEGIWISSDIVWYKDMLDKLFDKIAYDNRYVYEGAVVAFMTRKNDSDYVKKMLDDSESYLRNKTVLIKDLIRINYLWELFDLVNDHISIDLEYISTPEILELKSNNKIGDYKVYAHHSANIYQNTFFDTTDGDIVINSKVTIYPFCYLKGPVFIDSYSNLHAHTIIKGGTIIGPNSNIGGEISNSIIQGHTNKGHYGYLGNSYIGEWANFGAGTTTSNLKNNYSSVRVRLINKVVETNKIKIGSFVGDYVKTAIGTTLNTGTIINFGCNVVTGNFPPQYLKPFRWYYNGSESLYEWDKFIETLRLIKTKKNVTITKNEIEFLRKKYLYYSK